jgi:hypothetical protein
LPVPAKHKVATAHKLLLRPRDYCRPGFHHPSITPPHVHPRSPSPLSPPLSKPSSLAPPHCFFPFRCRHPHFPVHRGPTATCHAASATGCGPRVPSLPREWPRPHVKLHHRDVPPKHRNCICRGPHHRASPPAFLQPSRHHHEVPTDAPPLYGSSIATIDLQAMLSPLSLPAQPLTPWAAQLR